MIHIDETKLQINGQHNLPKISEILTYFHTLASCKNSYVNVEI